MTAMQAERICIEATNVPGKFNISGIYDGGFNWQVPFVKCDSRKCKTNGEDAQPFCEYAQIGVAPSTSTDTGGVLRAEDFAQYIYQQFPVLTTAGTPGSPLPFDFELVRMFNSSQDMDMYVQGQNYGVYPTAPKLVMGIVWEGNDPNNYIYDLRQNSTNFNAPEKEARPAISTTPPTDQLFASFAKTDFDTCRQTGGSPQQGPLGSSCTGQYMYNGVLTFQRLIGNYILDRTGAASAGYSVSEAGVRYVQFPTRQFTQNGFYTTIKGTEKSVSIACKSLLSAVSQPYRWCCN